MSPETIRHVNELIDQRRYVDALSLLEQTLVLAPSFCWSWYTAGQCCRALGNSEGAIYYLARASALAAAPERASVSLALGIALEAADQWDSAREEFVRAIDSEPDFELAYNSLALGQRKRGELEKAEHNYDAGMKALARRLLKSMNNSRESARIEPCFTSSCMLWNEQALYAGLYACAQDEAIKGMATPSAEMAIEEDLTHAHGGLYWTDVRDEKGDLARLFLPNFFNTFRALLTREPSYVTLLRNRASVLVSLGRDDEARLHVAEAQEFAGAQTGSGQ